MSRGKGYGKKYNVIKSVSNKIETSLITDSAEVWAGKIILHPNDAFRLSIYGIHSKIDFEIFQKYVKKGDNVLDIGANIGYFTLMLAKLVGPTGKVFAFEPDPRNISLLKKNIETNGYQNVVVVPKAVSNVNEKCTLFTSQSSFGQNRIYEPKKTKNQKYVPIESETILLDDFFKNNENIENISFVKIDVEGAEKLVLEGMNKILNLNKNIKIFSEIDSYRLDDAGSSYVEVIDLLEKKGFTVFLVNNTDNKIIKGNIKSIGKILEEDSSSQNILCIREKSNID
ncbi:FkbM family methyltransferase [Candidatus Nitrosopelagicus sp.]|nr:FkbM family methyltransferase [Candidatus Nitrosopelagicus sp.]